MNHHCACTAGAKILVVSKIPGDYSAQKTIEFSLSDVLPPFLYPDSIPDGCKLFRFWMTNVFEIFRFHLDQIDMVVPPRAPGGHGRFHAVTRAVAETQPLSADDAFQAGIVDALEKITIKNVDEDE